jgi:hypothetical protein
MNQIGPIFKEAREQSGKTIEDAVKETKIARKYLLAIEDENFDVFPGETYLIGFIRNYSQFLGLDPDEMVLKYRDYKIQEQPAPIEQLTAKPANIKRSILLVIVAVMIVSSVLYIIFTGDKDKKKTREDSVAKKEEIAESPVQTVENIVVFEEEEIIQDFTKGDVIEVPIKNVIHRIAIDGIGDNLEFSIGDIPFSLSTDERVEIDFDRDGRKDVLFRTNRLGEGTVNLTIKKIFKTESSELVIGSEQTTQGSEGAMIEKEAAAQIGPPEVVIIKEDAILAKIPVAPQSGFQIVSSYEKTDINSAIQAVDTTYFGYIIDEGDKEEVLLKGGDELSFTANDVLRIMVANARGVELQINGISLALGKRGEIVAKIVRWYRDSEDSDLYHLIIDDWEK